MKENLAKLFILILGVILFIYTFPLSVCMFLVFTFFVIFIWAVVYLLFEIYMNDDNENGLT